mmetsp:Transcript_5566/g.12100  ORF Transcript_5566/g.12100 Transcript_5566/m.12100 type:complete len:233 (+) Transcript_5566:2204-2902(+)
MTMPHLCPTMNWIRQDPGQTSGRTQPAWCCEFRTNRLADPPRQGPRDYRSRCCCRRRRRRGRRCRWRCLCHFASSCCLLGMIGRWAVSCRGATSAIGTALFGSRPSSIGDLVLVLLLLHLSQIRHCLPRPLLSAVTEEEPQDQEEEEDEEKKKGQMLGEARTGWRLHRRLPTDLPICRTACGMGWQCPHYRRRHRRYQRLPSSSSFSFCSFCSYFCHHHHQLLLLHRQRRRR